MKGIFITFEGGEGSGKTTIIESIEQELKTLGYGVVKTREPGGSKIAEEIRNVILDKDNIKMDARTEALLYAASRRQHLVEKVIPNLEDGKIVLCDRYVDSSLAYQGYARGLGIEQVYKINQYATNGLLPDLTIYIDVNPSEGLRRIKTNNRLENRLDLENMNFHNQVRNGYLEVAKLFSDRINIVDGNLSKEEVYSKVRRIILEFLQKR